MSLFKPTLHNLREDQEERHNSPPSTHFGSTLPRDDCDNSSKHSYEKFAAEDDASGFYSSTTRANNLKSGNYTATRRRSIAQSQGSIIEDSTNSCSPKTSLSTDGAALAHDRLAELYKSYEDNLGCDLEEDESAVNEMFNLAMIYVLFLINGI